MAFRKAFTQGGACNPDGQAQMAANPLTGMFDQLLHGQAMAQQNAEGFQMGHDPFMFDSNPEMRDKMNELWDMPPPAESQFQFQPPPQFQEPVFEPNAAPLLTE